jgi:hypothetical protein
MEEKINKITVDFGNLKFFSLIDEDLFFLGLKKIRAVNVVGPVTFEIYPDTLTLLQRHILEGFLKRFFNKKKANSIIKTLEKVSQK